MVVIETNWLDLDLLKKDWLAVNIFFKLKTSKKFTIILVAHAIMIVVELFFYHCLKAKENRETRLVNKFVATKRHHNLVTHWENSYLSNSEAKCHAKMDWQVWRDGFS